MISTGTFKIVEFEHRRDGLHSVYQSHTPMCLKDASRFGAALSYARGAYVKVVPLTEGDYTEWWFCGQLSRTPEVNIVTPIELDRSRTSAMHNRTDYTSCVDTYQAFNWKR